MKRTIGVWLTAVVCLVFTVHGQDEDFQGLFESDEILDLELEFDHKELLKSMGDAEDDYLPAVLTLKESYGLFRFHLKVKARGHSRQNPDVCDFPPILLNFQKHSTEGTVFEGQNKLKLTTHCRKEKFHEQYVFKEYLIYKQYNQLTDKSFKVRLVKIKYIDTGNRNKSFERYGFLIESKKEMAKRLGGKVSPLKMADESFSDRDQLNLLHMFQLMIGNTDYSVSHTHNIKLLSLSSYPGFIPVPYDFDNTGAVLPPYGTPSPILPIEDIKTRLFRGQCYSDKDYAETVVYFNEKREDLYSTYRDFELLEEKDVKRSLKYLDGFYSMINDPKKLSKRVYKVCMRKPTPVASQAAK